MRIYARMINVAQKGVLLIVPIVIIENLRLNNPITKSQRIKANVSQADVNT